MTHPPDGAGASADAPAAADRPADPPEPGGDRIDLLGIGQCSIDHVCLVEGLPRFAGKAAMLGYELRSGGTVATAVLAATRLGLRAAFAGATGDDEAAAAVLAPLVAAGVDTRAVRRIAGARTRLAVILVDRASGERTVLGWRDPLLRLRAEDVPEARVRAARCLLLDAEQPEAALHAARIARAAGVPVVLDLDTPGPDAEALAALADYPIVSQHFAEAWGGDGRVRSGLRRLLEQGAKLAVATLGERGCLALGPEGELAAPAFPVAPRDTTGAGDVFHAAWIWGLLEGLPLAARLRHANAAAAIACCAPGAQGGLPDRAALLAFLARELPGPWRDPDAPPAPAAPGR